MSVKASRSAQAITAAWRAWAFSAAARKDATSSMRPLVAGYCTSSAK